MKNLDTVLANSVRRFADRTAIDDGQRSFTFSEVEDRISRIGTGLLALGLRPQDRIASLQFNAIEAFEFDLMAARFGFVRTLLNARADAADFAYVLDHCQAKLLVFGAEFTDVVSGLREKLKTVELFVCVGLGPIWAHSWDDLVGRSDAAPPPYLVDEGDWHSIYYTSGTTGRPKGVVLSQRNWLVVLRNHLIDPFRRASAADVLLHAAPMSHASGAFIFAHLARGARQFVIPRFDAGLVLETIARERATTTFLAPTMIMMMLQHPDHERFDKSSLHSVAYGGAPMALEHVREAMRQWGPVLLQAYGQWEAPQIFAYLDQEQHTEAFEESSKQHRLASAGLPLTLTKVAIVDDEGTFLPPGQEGEIVTAGDHLMVGYLDNPEATAAERIGSWQRTGDVGRIDTDGFIYLTDRKKDVIITGGSNVYPREIEEVLHAHPDVLEALAIGVPDEKWGERVHTLLVAKNGSRINGEAVLAWCCDRLSVDKRPRSFELVSELPKSAYGKILRREVREQYWQGRSRRI